MPACRPLPWCWLLPLTARPNLDRHPVDRPQSCDVAVVGAGIAGLTAAALLAGEGLEVVLLEAHSQGGGCAGTFRRGPYTFDVGATQVAGLERGGIHRRLFDHFGLALPAASPLDPGCSVQLAGECEPIRLWRDPDRWRAEWRRQFPGSERFWDLCAALHGSNWAFAGRDPVLPPRNGWDLAQLLQAIRPATLASGLASLATVADLLSLCGCGGDRRLRRFLDLQLKLYSQEPADRTAALYGATVLAMAQEPQGLWHLDGSMQELSRALEQALASAGGALHCNHRLTALRPIPGGGWSLDGLQGRLGAGGVGRGPVDGGQGGEPFRLDAREVVLTLPPQALPGLLGDAMPRGYSRRISGFGDPSGALVFYGAAPREALPKDLGLHGQWEWADPGNLFVSISREGDGRAPAGQATVIASVFTAPRPWFDLDRASYQARKAQALRGIQAGLGEVLGIGPEQFLHQELATPRGFARWTGRPFGFVGGLGQQPDRFGPFGLASRTPLPGLWLCGDGIHPGEGTAGVSLCALMVCRQLLAGRGRALQLKGD